MGLSVKRVSVYLGDTATAPYDQGTNSSRTIFHMGRAIVDGCNQLRAKLLAHAARLLEASQGDLEISDGRVAVKGTSNRSLSFGEVLSRTFGYGGSISVTGI